MIYKKDSKGKIRTLEIYSNGGEIVQVSGLENGKKVTNISQCQPKNEGKANATTAEQQACKEVKAKLIKKLNEGYFALREYATKTLVIAPMLAKVYGKESSKINWDEGVFVQPKLDGMRSLGIKDSYLESRLGNKIENLDHLYVQLNYLRMIMPNTIPDGELYSHGRSFQNNMKIIKKFRDGESQQVNYHLYDCITSKPYGFEERYEYLKKALKSSQVFSSIKLVPTVKVHSEEEIMELHQKYIGLGYEGTIVRHGNDPYKLNGRSSSLLKLKTFLDSQHKVVDVEPSDSRPEQGVIVCYSEKSNMLFKASLAMSHKERREVLKNKENYIGQLAEIRYFEETDQGLPRFPVCHGFRND